MVNHSVWCQSRMLSIRIDELKRLPMHTQTLSFSCVWYDLNWRSFEEQRLQIWNSSWHSLPCSNYTLTHSVPRCAVSCQQNAIQAARFIPTRVGTTRLHKPNVFQSALTHSSDRCQIKYNTHTHRYGHFHQKYSILFDNDDWCWSKKTLQQKQTPVVSINQLFGRGGTESPHWSSHRANVSISESFILGPISYTTSAALAKTESRTGYKTMDVISY